MSRFAIPTLVLFTSLSLAAAQRTALAAPGGVGFIENQGQLDAGVLYQLPGARTDVFLTRDAIVFDLKDERSPERSTGCAVFVRFTGANTAAAVSGRDPQRALHNYFIGNDPARWRTDVPSHREVVYRDLWPGVDLRLWEESGDLRYDLDLRPGADASAVGFSFEGATHVTHTGVLDRIEDAARRHLSHRSEAGRLVHHEAGRHVRHPAHGNEGNRQWLVHHRPERSLPSAARRHPPAVAHRLELVPRRQQRRDRMERGGECR
jgi:hypothetical protein